MLTEARATGGLPSPADDPVLAGPCRVEYRSAEYETLPVGDPRRRAAVLLAADRWHHLVSSPHLADLLAEFAEWVERRRLAEASHAVSEAVAGRQHGPSYAELNRRRHPPDGDAARWVAHGLGPCPAPPCTGLGCPQPDPDGSLRARYRGPRS